MQELDNTTAHSYFWQNFVNLRMHSQQQEFLLEVDFADITLKFNGFELNLNVFCTFLSDIYSWFDKVFFLFSSSILYDFTVP